MNTEKLIISLVTFSIMGFSGLFLPSTTYASTTASISPATGTYNSDFTLSILINTGGDTINGVDTTVTYSGNATYISGTTGNLGCTPTINASTSSISIICLIPPGNDFSGTGTLVQLTFRPSGTGTFTVTPTYLDVGGTTGTLSGGTYTITSSTTGTTKTSTTGTITSLPETGIIQDHAKIIGSLLLITSVVVVATIHINPQIKTNKEKTTRYEKKILETIE